MRYAGFHLSIAGGVQNSFREMADRGINTFQIFLKNNNRWEGKPYPENDISEFKRLWQQSSGVKIFAHTGYLINPASPAGEVRDKSLNALVDEIKRADMLGVEWLVLHPGSHKGEGESAGIKNAAALIDEAFKIAEGRAGILIETTAGQGDSIGCRFEHIRDIIAESKNQERLAVCFDTCHSFAAGYDFTTDDKCLSVLEEFGSVVGGERLKLVHLNDSKCGLGSRKDRHEDLGKGFIKLEGLEPFINSGLVMNVPLIMETPKADDELASDLENLKALNSIMREG